MLSSSICRSISFRVKSFLRQLLETLGRSTEDQALKIECHVGVWRKNIKFLADLTNTSDPPSYILPAYGLLFHF